MAHPALSADLRHLEPVVYEARKKFAQAVEDDVFDYKHYTAVHIEKAVSTLLRIFKNVVDNPNEPKFRKVNSTSKVLMNNVKNLKRGEHLLTLAGWKEQVVDYQKYWVFDAEEDSTRFRILAVLVEVLEHSLTRIHVKAEREKKAAAEKKATQKALREAVLLQLEDDKVERRLKVLTQPPVSKDGAPAQEDDTKEASPDAGPTVEKESAATTSPPISPHPQHVKKNL